MAGRNKDDTNDRLSLLRGKPIMFFEDGRASTEAVKESMKLMNDFIVKNNCCFPYSKLTILCYYE